MMDGEQILEELFSAKGKDEQKTKARRCRVICTLEPQERESLLAHVTARLQDLLNGDLSHGLSVCQRCEGCPALRKVLLGPCWSELLLVCCKHLQALSKEGEEKEQQQQQQQSWAPPLFSQILRVLYALLKEQLSQRHHQSRPPPPHLHKPLEAAHVALTIAMLPPLTSGSHTLVGSSALWLLLQYLDPQRATEAFLDTLWAVNYIAGRRRRRREAEINRCMHGETVKKGGNREVDGNEREMVMKVGHRERVKVIGDGTACYNDGDRVEAADCLLKTSKMRTESNGRKDRGGIAIGKGNLQELTEQQDTVTMNEQENLQEGKEEQEQNTLTNLNNENTAKATIINTTKPTPVNVKDVKSAIEKARKEEEGKKLRRSNFEGLEESCLPSITLILQGMLNAGGKWLLREENEEHRGRLFLYSLHSLLLKLCRGAAAQHTFQAFQTLHLWLRSVRDLGTQEKGVPEESIKENEEVSEGSTKKSVGAAEGHIPQSVTHPSQEPLFSMTPDSQGPVFTMLNANWENPTKGVGEMVGKCMEELFSLHEDGEKGASRRLAKEILEALLMSSSSTSISSVWASKSTYPPLALALTHLGCEKALQLYPSLPTSLTYSLGVNHLAPPGTTVYKVFLAHMGPELWKEHFLTPVCTALCSQDRLTQQHVLSLWLPPTLKQYPGIHWALLEPCGTDASSWLARMALLRVARSVGALHLSQKEKSANIKVTNKHKGGTSDNAQMEEALVLSVSTRDKNSEAGIEQYSERHKTSFSITDNHESASVNIRNGGDSLGAAEEEEEEEKKEDEREDLILKYISMALRHRDENVRLEAISLVCHTQKTSQPVAPFEAHCLRSFLTHNMNIDSAPLRQGILKCVAAVMVRVRGATASYLKSHSAKGGTKGSKAVGCHLKSAGSLRSTLVPGGKKKGKNCDENSVSSLYVTQDRSEGSGGNTKNLQKFSSVHKVNTQISVDLIESHQESANLRRNQQGHPEKNMEEMKIKSSSAVDRDQEEEEEEGGVLATSASIVLWLVREAHRGMSPDSNYQRHILALRLYKEVLLALLPPSVGHCPEKRTTTSPEPLLTHLNTLAQKGRDVQNDELVCRSNVGVSLQGSCGNRSTLDMALDGYDRNNVNSDRLSPQSAYESEMALLHSSISPTLDIHRDERKRASDQPLLNQTLEKQADIRALDIFGDKTALEEPLVNLAYPWTLNTLLHLVQDEMNDVRTEACEIIRLLAPQGKVHMSHSEGREWMSRALKLCDSPKASDAESGGTLALTVALLLPKECHRKVLEDVFGVDVKNGNGGGTPLLPLAECLLTRAECQLIAARTNLLRAAKHAPIHGTLQALRCCITQAEQTAGKEDGEGARVSPLPRDLPLRLAFLLQQLVEFVLDTLASTSPHGAVVAPSFAEMGEAVRRVVEQGKEEEREEAVEWSVSRPSVSSLLEEEEEEQEEDLLSSDHVLVLSCCWQILKSCCEVTSQAIHLFTHDPQAVDDLIRKVVVRILLGTRHKGAMEAARATYASLWAHLLQAATLGKPYGTMDSRFIDILHRQVSEVLWSLGAPSNTSVTRRAAGVAMMVQAACGAAPRTTTLLLTNTLTILNTIARTKVAVDQSGTTDAPPALAIHVLQSLTLHSSLGPYLQSHLATITSTCLHAFSSPSWAVRNAALQLFGSLVSCLVGQKKVRDDTSALNSLTTPEFVSRHPSLALHLLSTLESDGKSHEGKNSMCYSASAPEAPNTLVPSQDTEAGAQVLSNAEIHLQEDANTHTEVHNIPTHSQDVHTLQHTDICIPIHTKTQTLPHPTRVPEPPCTCTHTHFQRASILVPVLSLIARLSPGTGLQQNLDLTKTLHRLWHSTACLLSFPVYSVRRLAAQALVSLTPSNEAHTQTLSILWKVSDLTPTNLLHGYLLAVHSFLQTHPQLSKCVKVRNRAIEALSWLLGPGNKCHVNSAVALKIMVALEAKKVDCQHTLELDSSLPGVAECHLTLALQDLSTKPQCAIERLILSHPPVNGDILDGCSEAILAEIRECQSALWLLRYMNLFWKRIDDDRLHDYTLGPKGVAALLSFLAAIMEKEESAGLDLPEHLLPMVLSCMEGHQGSRTTCAALSFMAHWLKRPHATCSILKAFTAAIMHCCQPTASESHRLAASTALKVAIKPLLCQCYSVDQALSKLIVATVTLLQDEDSAVRDSAAGIVEALLKTSEVALPTPTDTSGVQYNPLQSPPTLHPNLALYEFLQWLAKRSLSAKDWSILRVLWQLCSGQAGLESSLQATTLKNGHTRLFQSHSANLYQEPKQLSIMVGVALLGALKECGQMKKGGSTHENRKNEKKSDVIQENYEIIQENMEHKNKFLENYDHDQQEKCYKTRKIHENKHRNYTVSQEDRGTQQENTNSSLPANIPDWLMEERLTLNYKGEKIISLASKHSLWHHTLLASEAGVYVVSCRVFQWLCGVFGVSTKLTYPLEWGKKGYCALNEVG